uniref:Uncharacterized protein n=1 Tax=Rhizophora mucronata TaxID=61149 RepID=A0A2P2P9G7_RHIMU
MAKIMCCKNHPSFTKMICF